MIRGREPEILDSGARHAVHTTKKKSEYIKSQFNIERIYLKEKFFFTVKSVRLRIISDFLLRKGESW